MIHHRPEIALALLVATSAITLGCGDAGDGGCVTPLVLSFDGSAVQYVAPRGDTYFELGQHDAALTTDWPTAKTPWLARDLDGDGRIAGGAELFGSETQLRTGRTAFNGFEALRALDGDGDGRVSESDADWSSVLVWRDLDADRRSGSGELQTSGIAGLLWIGLPQGSRSSGSSAAPVPSSKPEPRCDADGNCEVERAEFAYVDDAGEERRGYVIDIHLRSFNRGASSEGGSTDDFSPYDGACPLK